MLENARISKYFCPITVYSGIHLIAARLLLIKWLLLREVANQGTELTQNLQLEPEDWLLIE